MIVLLIMATCLVLNALLSGIEMAFVTVGKPQLRSLARKGNKEASRVLSLRDNPERTLSVLQVGITMLGVFAAVVGGAGGEESLSPLLESRFGLSENTANSITILAVTIPYSFLSVIISELVPKSIALKHPTGIILKSARTLSLIERIFSPIVTLLELSTKAILRPFRFKAAHEAAVSGEPLDLETLTQLHRQYMLNLFDIRRKSIRDVMIPWEEAVSVELRFSPSEVASTIHATGHTRLPVVSNGEMIGILHTKEFMALRAVGGENWDKLIRPAVHIRDSDSLIRALKLMQEKHSHLSIAYSGARAVGIVSMEDIFEEIIGDIFDEDDDGNLKRILTSSRRDRIAQLSQRKHLDKTGS